MSKLTIDIDLDVDTPEKVAAALREIADTMNRAAEQYEQSPDELAGAWGDPNAGKVWHALAARMRGAAGQLHRQADLADRNCARLV